MPLVAGSRLDSYEIIAPLGVGGMGEVYRARDATLKRDVAIKVLPEYWSGDPERLRRFEQEAQAAAALNHPNIVSIFHVGQYDGSPYIVTELLQGETLRDRLGKGPMRIREVVDFGVPLARGLAAAHDAGIVHRDLKPENIWITKDGRIKILDFGLAKLDPDQVASVDGRTITLRKHSSLGQIVGTVGYMSPEQVRGQPTDARGDIFALGAILYEMLNSQRAFKKATSAETMTAILHEDPPAVSQIAANVPPGLQKIINRCLSKSPEQRLQHASDLAFALEALSDFSGIATSPVAADRASSSRTVWIGAVAGLVVIATAFLFWWTRPPGAPVVEAITQLTDDAKGKVNLQTDGARIYFNEDQSGLAIMQVSVTGGAVAPVPSIIAPAAVAGIAPDASSLLVLQGAIAVPRPVWELPLPAGEPRRMGNLDAHEASMTPDGRLVLSRVEDLFITEKDGSNPRKIISLPKGHFGDTAMSPDGRRIVFTFYGNPELYIANSDGSGVRPLAKNSERGGFCCARWTPDGRYIVFATRFPDPRQDLWYLRMDDGWVQKASQPKRLTVGPLSYWSPVPSRDGNTIFATGITTRRELVRYDLTSHTFVPLVPDISATGLTFSADGQWMAYVSNADHCLWRSRSDGSDRLQLTFPPVAVYSPFISPDGKWVVYGSNIGTGNYMLSLDGGTSRKVIDAHGFGANWSPDGVYKDEGCVKDRVLLSGVCNAACGPEFG